MSKNSSTEERHFGIFLASYNEDGTKNVIYKRILQYYAKYGSYASYHLPKFKYYDAYTPISFIKYKKVNENPSKFIKQINILRKKYVDCPEIMDELNYIHMLLVVAKTMDNFYIRITPYFDIDPLFTPGAVLPKRGGFNSQG